MYILYIKESTLKNNNKNLFKGFRKINQELSIGLFREKSKGLILKINFQKAKVTDKIRNIGKTVFKKLRIKKSPNIVKIIIVGVTITYCLFFPSTVYAETRHNNTIITKVNSTRSKSFFIPAKDKAFYDRPEDHFVTILRGERMDLEQGIAELKKDFLIIPFIALGEVKLHSMQNTLNGYERELSSIRELLTEQKKAEWEYQKLLDRQNFLNELIDEYQAELIAEYQKLLINLDG
jgi:hypothetical protein